MNQGATMGKGESLAGKRLAESTREVGSGVESGFGMSHTQDTMLQRGSQAAS